MKRFPLSFPTILVLSSLPYLIGCGAAFGTKGKNKPKPKDSNQEVALLVTLCLDSETECVDLRCEDIRAIESEGRVHDGNRDRFLKAIAICDRRGSSHDLTPASETDEDCPEQNQ